MDLFVYQFTETLLVGYPINGYTSVTWVERYQSPGEFSLVAPLSSGLRDIIPVGSVVGQIQSLELMIIENVEIEEDIDEEPIITFTGRSFVSFLDQRISGMNFSIFGDGDLFVYTTQVGAYEYGIDLVGRLQEYIKNVSEDSSDTGNNLLNFKVTKDVPLMEDELGSLNTYFEADNVLKVVLERIKALGIGIRTKRRNMFPGYETVGDEVPGTTTDLHLFVGEDRTATVKFTPQTGDIEASNYLWTNKNYKTSALVKGKWIAYLLHPTDESGLERRVMLVDGRDIDDHLETPPVPLSNTSNQEMLGYFQQRALDSIARAKQIAYANTVISKNSRYRYRVDYDIGDVVMVDTTYGESIPMRVIEFAEIQDENGHSGYPTLATIE